MKFATWNVNGVRARINHLEQWLCAGAPDVVGLQETKVQDESFPLDSITSFGYQVCYRGQKAYNGIAILSRRPVDDVSTELEGAQEAGARFIAASITDGNGEVVRFINVYVINGKEVGHQAYWSKLDFLNKLADRLEREKDSYGRLMVVGDFNIAPTDDDVYDPDEWRGKILCSDRERESLARLMERAALVDVLPLHRKGEQAMTWWDYRAARYRRKQGLRIDHILASHGLAERCDDCWVDRAPRELEKPSDHAPVVVNLV